MSTLIDVVQWRNQPNEIMYRFPEGAVSLAAQLIVMENQEAVFFRSGKIVGIQGPGRCTLDTFNIPILEKVVNLPFAGKSPFPAEIYFVNKTEIPDFKWGTKVPITLQDPVYKIPIPIRAFGNFSIKITDVRAFVVIAIGTWQAYTTQTVETTLRNLIIVPKLSDLISGLMEKENITILRIAPFYDRIGEEGRAKISTFFSTYGLELTRFVVESINAVDEDESVKRLKKALADTAEIDIMGTEKYKMRRTFDTMEKAATSGGEGMGAGGFAGIGVGLGIGQQMAGIMGPLVGGVTGTGAKIVCPKCSIQLASDVKFCSSCGTKI